MSTVLRKLLEQPHGHVAAKGYLDFMNYCVPGLMTEDAVVKRIASSFSSTVNTAEGLAAIRAGFAAARRKPS
jgi:hypothetical protein